MTTISEMRSRVDAIEPVIRRHAADAERSRRMAPEVMTAVVDAGLLRMWVPAALGGSEMPPNDSLDVMEHLARIDPATGWIVSNCVFLTTICQFLPPVVQKDILGDERAVTCGTFVPPGTATATADGYVISGNWTFGSASHYATSLVTFNVLVDGDGPVLGEDGGPVGVVAYLQPSEVTLHDTWYTLGLRATGSTNFSVDALEVPRERTFVLGPWTSPDGPFSGPLYRLGIIMDAVRIATVGVGIAQGALDAVVELASSKTPAYTVTLTADRATVQDRVARAQALVQAARHTLRATVAEAWEAIQDGSRITGPACVPMGLASSFALEASVEAVDLLYQSAGSTAFRDECPLQQRFRDVQTLRQNTIASWSRYEQLGKMLLGRPSDWVFHQL